jgi:two-component system, NtrC family, sensor kinase
MWKSWLQHFQSALRYKLLALVVLPLLAAMIATLGYTLYWFHGYTQESLNLALRDHLTVARQVLREFQDERQFELQQLAESAPFRAMLRRQDRVGIQRALQRMRDAKGFAFLHVTGLAGEWLYEDPDGQRTSKPSPLTDRAGRGFLGAGLEVFRVEDLRRESKVLPDLARVEWRPDSGLEERGLVLRLVQPITDEQGRVSMLLDAGLLLNRNHAAVSAMSNRVFVAESLPSGAEPIVSLLLDDVRIAAAGENWNSLVGTRLPKELRARLDERGGTPKARETLVDETYVSAYGGFYDVNGQRIGALQVGARESAFLAGYYGRGALLLSLFLLATLVAAWMAVRGVRTVLTPVETMAAVVRATRAGEDRRIGPIGTRDEIGELAREFDHMLDQLAARNREIQRAAAALEIKVAERTQELAHKNRELEDTIALLEKTQEQLALADKLSALGKMAAGIAHEINNPAAVILGNLDVLAAELGPAAQPVAREIELIAAQVERIRHIVTSLLQFARARPGTGEIADIGVNQLVQEVLPLVAHALKTKSINLRSRLEATGVIAINLFDLQQVLVNLIVNAANACEPRGEIEITTADWNADGAVISVRDDGCGIPPDDVTRIFDPFFTTDPQRGAGLGLSVSYGLVRRYGGRITVESAVGSGSVFKIWLTRRPEATLAEAGRRAGKTVHDDKVGYG